MFKILYAQLDFFPIFNELSLTLDYKVDLFIVLGLSVKPGPFVFVECSVRGAPRENGVDFFECEKRPLGSLCLFPPWRMNGLRVCGSGPLVCVHFFHKAF